MTSVTARCGACGRRLRADGPSMDFCGQSCQEDWHLGRRPTQGRRASRTVVTGDLGVLRLAAGPDPLACLEGLAVAPLYPGVVREAARREEEAERARWLVDFPASAARLDELREALLALGGASRLAAETTTAFAEGVALGLVPPVNVETDAGMEESDDGGFF